jgi:hypothetical protein
MAETFPFPGPQGGTGGSGGSNPRGRCGSSFVRGGGISSESEAIFHQAKTSVIGTNFYGRELVGNQSCDNGR